MDNNAPNLNEQILDQIHLLLKENMAEEASSLFLKLHPADQAVIFNLLGEAEQLKLLPNINISSTADLFEELTDEEILEAIEGLSTEQIAEILDEMEPDEAADLLGDLSAEQATEVLAQMEDVEEILPLLGYPDETAGGLMTTWFIKLHPGNTAHQAIQFLREISPENDIPYYLYVVDRTDRLRGVLGLRELVISQPDVKIEEIMDRNVIFVKGGTDQEEVARVMSRYDLASIPVLDDTDTLLGVITYDDIVDVIEEEATEDIYRLANVGDIDLTPYSPINEQIRGRLPWVYINMITALFASWVVTRFEDIITEVAILAAFQSVVAGLGGNSATQNVTMIIRSLALGKIESGTVTRIAIRQIVVGFLQGIAVGIVLGVGVAIWQNNLYLGIILSLAMIGNMIIAGIIGTLVPMGLKAIGKDPAIASSVLVTAATDSLGFFIFFSLATLFLRFLG